MNDQPLVDRKPDMFFLNLCRAAENWRRFLILTRSRYQPIEPSLHYNTPLFAAIIAGDKKILSGLKAAMPAQWQKGEEYRDRFCSSWIYLLLAANGTQPDAEVEGHLHALRDCEKEPQRYPLFQALLGLDGFTEQDFRDQFEAMLSAQEEMIEAKALTTAPLHRFAAHRFLWFEGISLLRLARSRGYNMPSKGYLYCPDEALESMPVAYPGDWVMLSEENI